MESLHALRIGITGSGRGRPDCGEGCARSTSSAPVASGGRDLLPKVGAVGPTAPRAVPAAAVLPRSCPAAAIHPSKHGLRPYGKPPSLTMQLEKALRSRGLWS